jgi:hypothetical protein
MQMKMYYTWVAIAFQKKSLTDSILTGFLVGLVLNLINQWNLILSGDFVAFPLAKMAFTFFVPVIVSNYASTTVKMKFMIGSRMPVTADLKCDHCQDTVKHYHKNDTIGFCDKCMEHTDWRLEN